MTCLVHLQSDEFERHLPGRETEKTNINTEYHTGA